MKKLGLFVLLSLLTTSLFGQVNISVAGKAKAKIIPLQGDPIDIGKQITLKEVRKWAGYTGPDTRFVYHADCDGKEVIINADSVKNIVFQSPDTREALWAQIAINSGLYTSLMSKGPQYDVRSDLEDDSIELMSNLERYGWFFKDEYLEDYLQSLLYKIHPVTLNDSRPGNLIIKVLKSGMPNAFSTSNGTIMITTGLLSTVRSEDELIGVLAHETAHFVLDHQIVNINIASARKKRAEFWAGVATAIAAGTETYLAAKKNVYADGSLTLATAVLATSVADSILDRLGAKFSREQESEADAASARALEFMKRDPKALSAALTRVQKYCLLNGDYIALSASGTHPSLSARIAAIGKTDPEQFNSPSYDRLISFVISYNAANEYGMRHLETTLQLVDRNIETGAATEEDYLLKGMVLRALYDTPDRNQEALANFNKAKTLSVNPELYPQVYKEEGITLLRLGKTQEAVSALQTYLQRLEGIQDKSQSLTDEIIWTRKLIFRTKGIPR